MSVICPKDARTFISTPASVDNRPMHPGHYVHISIWVEVWPKYPASIIKKYRKQTSVLIIFLPSHFRRNEGENLVNDCTPEKSDSSDAEA